MYKPNRDSQPSVSQTSESEVIWCFKFVLTLMASSEFKLHTKNKNIDKFKYWSTQSQELLHLSYPQVLEGQSLSTLFL